DEVVCLGAGITGGGKRVETIVENRMQAGTNEFIADGSLMPVNLGWSNTTPGLSWCALEGVGGYYFPGSAAVSALREERTGSWHDINQNRGLTNSITRNYFTLWFDHGIKPVN